MPRFGISSYLFEDGRLSREHLVHIAAHGFEAIEIHATRAHFDYRDERAVADVGEWLADTGLELVSVHAPIGEPTAEIQAAIDLAARLPYRCLVMHPGPEIPTRLLPDLAGFAADRQVKLALEIIATPRAPAEWLVRLIEEELDGADVGICLDYGHAHLMGDLAENIEAVSGHVITTHLHDNHGKRDEHLVPYGGTISWDTAMMETQKIGYDGVLMFEVSAAGNPVETLKRSIKARERLEKTFVIF